MKTNYWQNAERLDNTDNADVRTHRKERAKHETAASILEGIVGVEDSAESSIS